MPQLADYIFLFTRHWKDWPPEPINDALLILFVFGLALFLPNKVWRIFGALENLAGRLAARRTPVIIGVGLLTFAVNAAISILGQWPVPGVQDEFSYLLQADTFLHGRLANPTPPLWVHFETFHVIFQPTYVSKYPPGQGLMLALGQLLTGQAIIGSWLGSALAVAALCWMIYQWLPPRWALAAGVLAAADPIIIYWSQTYWGCQWAIVGGALILGGFKQVLPSDGRESELPRRAGWLMGAGIALMMITRPYEGLALTSLLLAVYGWSLLRDSRARSHALRVLMPLGLCLVILGAWLGYYNYRTTGHPAMLPYAVHEKTYGVSPLLMWQSFKPEPVYRHELLRRAHVEEEPPAYLHHRTSAVVASVTMEKLGRLLLVYCQCLPFAGALPAAFCLFCNRRYRWLGGVMGLFCLAVTLEVWVMPHYMTPVVPLFFLLGLGTVRYMRAWRWHRKPLGLRLSRLLVLLNLLSVVSSGVRLAQIESPGIIYDSPGLRQFALQRKALEKRLESLPGQHLVIVSYEKSHNWSQEWVYNTADLEQSRVVWARAMPRGQDRELIRYYFAKKRRIWRIKPDGGSLNLAELSSGQAKEN